MWHYLYFIVLVKVKDPTEFTGPESYVYAMIKVNSHDNLHGLYTSSNSSDVSLSNMLSSREVNLVNNQAPSNDLLSFHYRGYM